QRMPEGSRAGVRNARHFQYRRHVRVAGLSLNAVGHVEYHPCRPSRGGTGGDKSLELGEKHLVALAASHGMPACLQSRHDHLDVSLGIALTTGRTEAIDHAVLTGIPNHRNFHDSALLVQDSLEKATPASGRLLCRKSPPRHFALVACAEW